MHGKVPALLTQHTISQQFSTANWNAMEEITSSWHKNITAEPQ
jgi:hypothetical protein